MNVIRHHYPSQRISLSLGLRLAKLGNHQSSQSHVMEKWMPASNGGGQQIQASFLREATFAQIFVVWWPHHQSLVIKTST